MSERHGNGSRRVQAGRRAGCAGRIPIDAAGGGRRPVVRRRRGQHAKLDILQLAPDPLEANPGDRSLQDAEQQAD